MSRELRISYEVSKKTTTEIYTVICSGFPMASHPCIDRMYASNFVDNDIAGCLENHEENA